ncbi:Long-chain fatty acid transport protein [Daejeonella rubra]|uniref:Long-chain fatty acid transport protein n=1 Tax=Daejeonella rubra TaxID=990371 RepID=A0A1G9WIS4_9SPHI|nr:type IX secretion system outer membrane channel protein PorV [Daejeonella rubra]SDM84370.1 Long-chain fatty acid transport protein [Daejeonella rubra]
MIKKRSFFNSLVVFILGLPVLGLAQTTQSDGKRSNTIQTAAPFLLITPDARSGAMGDAGVAISPDANSLHWNPAKMAFLDKPTGLSASYTPWLRNLVPDVDLGYLTIYHRLDSRNTIGGALRYFSYGSIQLTDNSQNDIGVYSPNEFSIEGTYSRKFGDSFSLGTAIRYIRSSLSNGQFNGQDIQPATALAADASAYYKSGTILFGKDAELAFGLNISNVGSKMSYSDNGSKSFLPTNMKLGGASTFMLDDLSTITFALDLNKLLVPTSPIRDANGQIISGKDPDRSVPSAIFGSFTDAPGGFSEEISEISYSLGTEYWYNKQFAIRSGYFYETPTKGDRRYFTVGAGLKYNVFNLDFAYLMANQQTSPLAQTLRFSLVFNFEK